MIKWLLVMIISLNPVAGMSYASEDALESTPVPVYPSHLEKIKEIDRRLDNLENIVNKLELRAESIESILEESENSKNEQMEVRVDLKIISKY